MWLTDVVPPRRALTCAVWWLALQALVDGPYTVTGVSRQQINFKRLSLTDLKVKIGVNAGHKALTTAWEKADIKSKWAATSWGQRLAKRAAKAATTDFDRFAAMVTKKTVRRGGTSRGVAPLHIPFTACVCPCACAQRSLKIKKAVAAAKKK